jgi:hypothetical protein
MSWCLVHTALKGFHPKGEIFGVTIGRAAREACSAMWNLGTNSAFALGPRKTLIELGKKTITPNPHTNLLNVCVCVCVYIYIYIHI